jgi:zinc protease
VHDVEIVEGADLKPVITDDFVLIPNPRECKPGQTFRVVFRASGF